VCGQSAFSSVRSTEKQQKRGAGWDGKEVKRGAWAKTGKN